MPSSDLDVLVIGGGIAGLTAARELSGAGREVLVVDAGSTPGGVMRSERVDSYLVECGPNTMRVNPSARAFLQRAGLMSALVRAGPASRKRYLLRNGGLVSVPLGPLSLAFSPLLSRGAKFRLLREPLIRRGDPTGESVSEFMSRRLGPEIVPALVGPFLTGVYAGDETRLGAESVFSSLTDFERAHGSIALGGLRQALRRGAPRGLPGSWSGVGGLGSLAARIAQGLPIRKATRVENLARDGETWRIEVSGGEGSEALHAESVVLAVPARETAELVRGVARNAADILSTIECAPVVSLALGVDPRELARPVDGFGFLVPREEKLGLLGCLFMSEIFPQRAPEGRVLLQCMLGGVRWPEAVELPDDALVERVRADLDRALGLRGEPELLRIERWPRAIPQPGLDHGRRISALRKSVAQLPGLHLAGSYLDGVAVSDALTSGLRAAREIVAAQEASLA